MAGDENVTAKAMKAPEPQEYLDQLQADFMRQADALEREANEHEDRAMHLRANAGALRTAAAGLEAGVERYHAECAKAKEFRAARDGEDKPAREIVRRGGYPDGY